MKSFRFERSGAFAYSEADGTSAAELPEQVPMRVRWMCGTKCGLTSSAILCKAAFCCVFAVTLTEHAMLSHEDKCIVLLVRGFSDG